LFKQGLISSEELRNVSKQHEVENVRTVGSIGGKESTEKELVVLK